MNSELIALETQGWQALSASRAAAAQFFRRALDDDPVFVLPGGTVLDDRDSIVQSVSGQPWSTYELSDLKVLQPAPGTAIVVYAATATRDGNPPYSALMTSTYIRRPAGWKLAMHQQTPC